MKTVNFLLGNVKIKAEGGFGERFINLCRVHKVNLKNIKYENNCIFAETDISSFRRIRTPARKSGVKVSIISKSGLPFIYKSFYNRVGLLFGIAAACFLLLFYSRSVWYVDIKGNVKIEKEQIYEVLSSEGVETGKLKKDIDTDGLKLALSEKIPSIAWVSISVDGSRMIVELREVTERPENKDSKEICNIVASKDGVIDKVRLYEGQSVIKEGEAVTRGQLLVSGIVFHEAAKKNTFHFSRAEVWAFTTSENIIKVPRLKVQTVYTGREKTLKSLTVFRLRFPLYLFNKIYSGEVTSVKNPFYLNGRELPLGISETNYKETETRVVSANKKSALITARNLSREYEKSLKSGTKILKTTLKESETDDYFIFKYTYKLYENIAAASKIETQTENINNSVEMR